MAEGLFRLNELGGLPFSEGRLRSVLRLDTGRSLSYRFFDDEAAAKEWTGFVSAEDGAETFRWGITDALLADLDYSEKGEDWSGFISHELVEHLNSGGKLPHIAPWKGTGTCVVISSQGYILTNQHLISGPQRAFELPEEVFDPIGVKSPSLKVCTPEGETLGETHLCYCSTELDLAILRIETTASLVPVQVASHQASRHQRCWMFGFPCRTVRPEEQLAQFGYHNADYGFRASVGLFVNRQNKFEWLADCDSGPGSSGSSVFDDKGDLIGLFRGVARNGLISKLSGISGVSHPAARLKRIVDVPGLLGKRIPLEPFEFDAQG